MNNGRNPLNSGGRRKPRNSDNQRKSADSAGPEDRKALPRYSFIDDDDPTQAATRKSAIESLVATDPTEMSDSSNSDKEDSEVKYILKLPIQLRCLIWKRVGYKSFRSLRLTCKEIKNDIDHHVGVSVFLDFDNSSFNFIEEIGIRKAIVINLSAKSFDFLLHPQLLVELSIHGPISTSFIKYLLKSCENIYRLSIVFNKRMLKLKPALFPQTFPACLPKCKAIRFVSHTKREKDLIYICDNITGLVKDTLEDSKGMTGILFSLIHSTPSPYLEELVLEIIVFAHKHSKTLQQFHLNIKEKEINKGRQEAAADDDEEGCRRRDTGAVPQNDDQSLATSASNTDTNISEAIANFANDRKNTLIMEDAAKYVSIMTWERLFNLKKVNISVNSRALEYLQGMVMKSPHLSSLQLELNGGVIRNCWTNYREIVLDICESLTAIKLVGVSYLGKDQDALDIDFTVFKNCICLKKLYLSCIQKEVNLLNRAANISKLPKTLEDFEIGWITLSAWQWFILLFSYKKLDKVATSYATSTESNFGWHLRIIRWLITWKLTKVQLFTVTDIKIKFRNKRSAVKQLEKAVPIKIVYHDMEETLLMIDRGQARKSEVSIPSIGSE